MPKKFQHRTSFVSKQKAVAEMKRLENLLERKNEEQIDLADQLETSEKKSRVLSEMLTEERKKSGELLPVKAQKLVLEHQIEVIRLLAEGKVTDAILSVLRKDVMLFGMDVRFADDGSLQKAKQETLEGVLNIVRDTLSKIKIIDKQEDDRAVDTADVASA